MENLTDYEESKVLDLTKSKEEPSVTVKIPFTLYQPLLQLQVQENATEEQTRGSWSEEEDIHLLTLVAENGPKRWSFLASKVGGR
jgi:hypothetical protein